MKARLKKLAVTLICAFVCYAGSYVCLSALGRYEPAAYDLRGVMWLSWAPEGFYSESKPHRLLNWNKPAMYAYLPFLVLDWQLWHREVDRGEQTKFPVENSN
jgi:hypothetical protein